MKTSSTMVINFPQHMLHRGQAFGFIQLMKYLWLSLGGILRNNAFWTAVVEKIGKRLVETGVEESIDF